MAPSSPPAPAPSQPRPVTWLTHLLLPGQAFSGRGQPLARWGWTVLGLLTVNFVSFSVFVAGDRRWLLLWPLVAGAAAWHFFRAARPALRRPRGEVLYALAALLAWVVPALLGPVSGAGR